MLNDRHRLDLVRAEAFLDALRVVVLAAARLARAQVDAKVAPLPSSQSRARVPTCTPAPMSTPLSREKKIQCTHRFVKLERLVHLAGEAVDEEPPAAGAPPRGGGSVARSGWQRAWQCQEA